MKTRYASVNPNVSNDRRLNDSLGLGIGFVIDLGDLLRDDLDPSKHGIGWWEVYKDIDAKTRIFISDYLVSCARDVATNLLEAYAYRLEFDHALEDFKAYMARGISKNKTVIPEPRGMYEELSYFRVSAHLVGVLRAFGSALDCLGGCIVGVAGLPIDIVRTSHATATDSLSAQGATITRLGQLHSDLLQCESSAGPAGWTDWLVAMRNTVVHRARRIVAYSIDRGVGGQVSMELLLPQAPELTEVEGWIYAGGYVASQFQAPADDFLTELAKTVNSYADCAARLLIDLWRDRQANPSLIVQPVKQWKNPKGVINPVPAFGGYPVSITTSQVTGVGVANETAIRLTAAALTDQGQNDIRPSSTVWR